MHEILIDQTFSFIVAATALPDITFFKNGAATVVIGSTVTLVSTGFYRVTFTPTTTGYYQIAVNTTLVADLSCVAKLSTSFLRNIEDEALGSWQWNKTTGVLTMLRQDGTALATFEALDSVASASREVSI